jgi:hypothetical protein
MSTFREKEHQMTRIIERHEDATTDERVLPFKVYQSEDGKTVFGHITPVATLGAKLPGQQSTTWEFVPYGTPVDGAFRAAFDLCECDGITALWVDDPHGLFPPPVRPVIRPASASA